VRFQRGPGAPDVRGRRTGPGRQGCRRLRQACHRTVGEPRLEQNGRPSLAPTLLGDDARRGAQQPAQRRGGCDRFGTGWGACRGPQRAV